jgi:single-stranded DNA-binding protein
MPANSSLVEKVAKFIQNGDLDTIEGKFTNYYWPMEEGQNKLMVLTCT